MDSFGVYVEHSAETTKYATNLHVNLWELTKKKCYIDFGVLIKNRSALKSVIIAIPFEVKTPDFIDLSQTMIKNPNVNRLIFNRAASINVAPPMQKNGASIVTLTIPTITDSAILLPIISADVKVHDEDEKFTFIRLDIDKIPPSQNNCKDVYFRFRVKSDVLRQKLLSSMARKNYFLESAFKSTEMIDFKVNELRNTESCILDKLPKGFVSATFERVDFFVMERATNDVDGAGSQPECRKLEEEWHEYIEEEKPLNGMIAYQWTKKEKKMPNDNVLPLASYSQLVKVTYADADAWVIILYVFAVVFLSVFSNWVYDGLCRLIS